MEPTEKMLPAGMMPGKDEIDTYRERYKDPGYTLVKVIEDFDFKTLPEQYVTAFCKRLSSYTGVGYKFTPEPVRVRRGMCFVNYDRKKRDLESAEKKFRADGSEKAYATLRKTFSTAVGSWVCQGFVQEELENTSEEELKRQEEAKEAEDKAWEKELVIREKIHKLNQEDPYFLDDPEDYLDENELEVLDKMLEEQKQYERENPEPYIQVQKLQMLRKALKKNQRDFAKLIGYPVGKYPDFEKGKIDGYWFSLFGITGNVKDFEWFMKLARATRVNPEWLLDESESSIYDVDEEATLGEGETKWGWAPMWATEEEIDKWEKKTRGWARSMGAEHD